MNFRTIAAVISTVLAIYACIPYAISIVKGRTKPHQLSWVVFAIMSGISAASQLLAGGRGSVLVPIVFFFGSLSSLTLSFKYGTRKSSPYDKLLFSLALVTILIWYLTKSNATAIWLTALIDVFATTMIILKIRAQPHSEAPYPWFIATLAYTFTCLTLIGKPVSVLYVRPLYGFLSEAAVWLAIVIYSKKSAQKITITPNET
jgi:hypothetical protein